MLRLALKTSTSCEDYYADCEVAVIHVTPELLDQLARRLALAQEAFSRDCDVRELTFYGSTAEFYEYSLVADLEEEVDGFSESYDSVGQGEIPDDFDLTPYEPQRTESDRLIIRLDTLNSERHEVTWETVPKHSGIQVTCSTEIAELQALLADDKSD